MPASSPTAAPTTSPSSTPTSAVNVDDDEDSSDDSDTGNDDDSGDDEGADGRMRRLNDLEGANAAQADARNEMTAPAGAACGSASSGGCVLGTSLSADNGGGPLRATPDLARLSRKERAALRAQLDALEAA